MPFLHFTDGAISHLSQSAGIALGSKRLTILQSEYGLKLLIISSHSFNMTSLKHK